MDDDDNEPVLRTGRVRIIGAEPAGGDPVRHDADGDGNPWPAPVEDGGTALPHWTEPPTGEVPAVLVRDAGDGGPLSSLPAPTWREEHADWTAHEETFEASMLAEDDTRLGSLDDSGESDRQPWSFELPTDNQDPGGQDAAGQGSGDQDTMVVPVVPRSPAPEDPRETGFRFDQGGRRPEDGDDDRAGDPVPAAPPAPEMPAPGDDLPEPPARRPARRPPRHRTAAARPPEPEVRRLTAPRRPTAGPEPEPATGNDRNLPLAVATGLVLGVVALVCFSLGTVASMVVVTVVVALAAMEAFAAFRKAGYRPATLLGLVATVSLLVATYNKGQEALPLVLVLVFAFTVLWQLAGVDRAAEPVRSTASTLLVFCWVAVFASFAALLLDPTLFPDRHGIAFLLGAVITGVAYDVGALAVGAWIGRHPLSVASPNKTWEGLVGGAVASVVVAAVAVHLIHPWTLGAAVSLGLVVAVVSPVGDLAESMVKRHLGLKDMGRILPGHGGLLDRVDGLLFVLPATYYLVKAFHLG